jgi:hypothetical protein
LPAKTSPVILILHRHFHKVYSSVQKTEPCAPNLSLLTKRSPEIAVQGHTISYLYNLHNSTHKGIPPNLNYIKRQSIVCAQVKHTIFSCRPISSPTKTLYVFYGLGDWSISHLITDRIITIQKSPSTYTTNQPTDKKLGYEQGGLEPFRFQAKDGIITLLTYSRQPVFYSWLWAEFYCL